MMIKVGIIGAAGRMGKGLIKAVHDHPQTELAAAVEAPLSPALGDDAASQAGLSANGIIITADLAAAFAASDVVIDFSFKDAFLGVLSAARAAHKPLVIGTTGLLEDQLALIDEAAQEIPVFQANNYSFGIAVLKKLVEEAARRLGPDFDIEISETHHKFKKDAPSGTALTLAEAAAAGRGIDPASAFCYGRFGMIGERPEGQIAIHALRGGDVVGEHTVFFFGNSERLTLGHSATSRMNFAHGAVRVASWLVHKPAGRYGIDQILVD